MQAYLHKECEIRFIYALIKSISSPSKSEILISNTLPDEDLKVLLRVLLIIIFSA